VSRVLKRVALLTSLLACASLTAAARPSVAAKSDPCALPAKKPVWIDYADGSTPYWEEFAKPGNVVAAANFIFPPQIRARGAKTVYFDLNFTKRTGTPTEPADPATVIDRANRLYTFASTSMGCATPVMGENELQGAKTLTPWSPTNALYRQDVLLFLRTLASHGARPSLLVSSAPYTGGEAADWWRQVAQVATLVREVYFPAPSIYKLGAVQGSRTLRQMFRNAAEDFISIGIPPARIGLMLGFHTTHGSGGREGLKPASKWFEVTKLQALAAKQVGGDMGLSSIWSWGWATWTVQESDPDKPANACVYLWTRDPKLCDGPAMAGPRFNTNLTEGQLILPKGVRCTVSGQQVRWRVAASISAITRDSQAAFAAAYGRAVASSVSRVSSKAIVAAEKAVIALHFHGSRAAYVAALRRAGTSTGAAQGVIADELRRAAIEKRLRVSTPGGSSIQSYYDTYEAAPARLVSVKPAAPWLGNARRGFALGPTAPPQIFSLKDKQQATVRTMTGTFKVKALAPTVSLAELPVSKVRKSIATALVDIARDGAYQNWLLAREKNALAGTLCWRDLLPAVEVVPLTDYLPYLALDSGTAPDGTAVSGRRGG
jgi:hypothetical protein